MESIRLDYPDPESSIVESERGPSATEVYRWRVQGNLPSQEPPFRLIDVFSGAGGMTLGFTEAFGHRFKPVWANDFDAQCVKTYNANFGEHCHHGDIVDLLSDPSVLIPSADVVIGGPPCQGFSLLNKERENDPRKHLWMPFFEIVRRSRARVFLMENVPQLLGSAEYQAFRSEAVGLGFRVREEKLCAADYGVPQLRWRAIVIGSLDEDPARVFPPKRTNFDHTKFEPGKLPYSDYLEDAQRWRTVRDAIGRFGGPKGTEPRKSTPPYKTTDLHFGRNPTAMSIQRYKVVGEGENRVQLRDRRPDLTPPCWLRKKSGGTDLFGRLWWDKPAFTIRTEFFKPEKGRYLHPEQHRPLTHREAARLQSFPDGFLFSGSKIEIARQIGNAVPPKMAARLADSVLALLLSSQGG